MADMTYAEKLALATAARTYVPIVEEYLAGRPVGPMTLERIERELRALDPDSIEARLQSVEDRVRELADGYRPDTQLALVRQLARGRATTIALGTAIGLGYCGVSASLSSLERKGIIAGSIVPGPRRRETKLWELVGWEYEGMAA